MLPEGAGMSQDAEGWGMPGKPKCPDAEWAEASSRAGDFEFWSQTRLMQAPPGPGHVALGK